MPERHWAVRGYTLSVERSTTTTIWSVSLAFVIAVRPAPLPPTTSWKMFTSYGPLFRYLHTVCLCVFFFYVCSGLTVFRKLKSQTRITLSRECRLQSRYRRLADGNVHCDAAPPIKYVLGYRSRTRTLTLNPNPITDPNPNPNLKINQKQNDTGMK